MGRNRKKRTMSEVDPIDENKDWRLKKCRGGMYADNDISEACTHNRTEFNQLVEDCRASKIDLVVVKDVSRFTRENIDYLNTAE